MSRYKLSLEDVDNFPKAIYETLDVEEKKVPLCRHNKMYWDLHRQSRVFLVHKVLFQISF